MGGPTLTGASYLDAATVATFVVAGVTLALVLVTGVQVRLSRSAFQMTIRPLLAENPPRPEAPTEWVAFLAPPIGGVEIPEHEFYWSFDDDLKRTEVSVPFRNIGSGVAVVTSAAVQPVVEGAYITTSRKFVPPGEHVRVNVSAMANFPSDPLPLHPYGSFSVIIGYSDADGGQHLLSRADIHSDERHDPYVRQIAILRKGETEPFVISGPEA
jgi:hypothetical protein